MDHTLLFRGNGLHFRGRVIKMSIMVLRVRLRGTTAMRESGYFGVVLLPVLCG
jgi:hypothetical protein